MLRTRHRSRPLSLIYDVVALCPSGCDRLLFFSFPLCALDKRIFCHSSLETLYPAPLLPLDDSSSIAWSVRTRVQYLKPNTWPSKLQSSLLGYFPGLYKTATGDTDAPSCHSCAACLLLLLLLQALIRLLQRWSSSITSCIRHLVLPLVRTRSR